MKIVILVHPAGVALAYSQSIGLTDLAKLNGRVALTSPYVFSTHDDLKLMKDNLTCGSDFKSRELADV